LFEGTGNVLQQSGNLFWNNTTNRLGIGTATPTAPIHILYNPASQNGINIDATANNVNHIGFLREGALYGRFGINASSGEFRWDCGAGLGSYFATIYTGNAERLRIFTDGNLGLNTSTNAGFRLDVNGTARVQGIFSALNASNEGIRLRNDTGSLPSIEFWQAVIRASITRETNNGLTFNCGGFAMHTVTGGTIIGGTSRNDLNASAQLQVQSTTKGFLPPRMTTTQKNAIASPATGLQVYDTTLNRPCFYDGTTWITL
jgi:hypothetical protein